MRKRILVGTLALVAVAVTAAAQAPATGPAHTIVTPDTLVWGPGPPALPKGVQRGRPDGRSEPAGPVHATRRSCRPTTRSRRTGTRRPST